MAKGKISQWAQEVAGVKRAKHGRAVFFFWTKLIFSFELMIR